MHYDTIIIGQDLSSLISAIASLRRDAKTILMMDGNVDTEYRDSGYAFPIDPTPLSGIGNNQQVFRLFRELQLPLNEAPQLLLMDPAFQVILPDHRVDLFHDRNELVGDLIREFPQQEQEIKRIYDAFSKASALVERCIDEDDIKCTRALGTILRKLLRLPSVIAGRSSLVIRENGHGHAFKRIIEAQISFLSHLDIIDNSPMPLSAGYLLSLPTRGIFYPMGSRHGWMSWLRQVFTDSGGILMYGCNVMRIDTKPGITIDVDYMRSSQTINGEKLILSANWEKLNPLLFHQKVFRRLVRRLRYNSANAYPFCVHLGIHEGGLPESMAPYTILVPDENKPACGQNLVFIERSLPGETNRAPEGRRAVSATVFLKESLFVLDDVKLKGVAKTVIDSIEAFLPFLRENVDYINIEKSITIARRSQEILSQKYRSPKTPIIGIKTLSQVTPLPNVFLTGGVFRAGLGFEGEILSGINAALMD